MENKSKISSVQKTKKVNNLLIIEDENDNDNKIESGITFTKNEVENYIRQKDKCIFNNPEEEYLWAKTQKKICSKCSLEKKLCDFNGNTSGADAFDRNGYRLRRPECNVCTKIANRGKSEAKKKAKQLGIPFNAPEGTRCEVCDKQSTPGNGIVFDHCHINNIFRGYCCNSCNRSIGVLGDNVPGLVKALNYLLKTEKRNIIIENGELIIL